MKHTTEERYSLRRPCLPLIGAKREMSTSSPPCSPCSTGVGKMPILPPPIAPVPAFPPLFRLSVQLAALLLLNFHFGVSCVAHMYNRARVYACAGGNGRSGWLDVPEVSRLGVLLNTPFVIRSSLPSVEDDAYPEWRLFPSFFTRDVLQRVNVSVCAHATIEQRRHLHTHGCLVQTSVRACTRP